MMILESMKHSPLHNYGGIPGLTSWLIGEPSPRGLVRLLECSRTHFEPIVPHSHRFDFECLVLRGKVRNIVWEPRPSGDEYETMEIAYGGEPGSYGEYRPTGRKTWTFRTNVYIEGETYAMESNEVHSIFFEAGTAVLFFEGPQAVNTSIFLQPVVDGQVVPTFKVEPWMFQRGEA